MISDLFGKITSYAGDEELFPKNSPINIELSKVKKNIFVFLIEMKIIYLGYWSMG